MKKIGLSVCYDTKNFGSQLQVLATVKKVEALGYDTEIIVYKKKLTPKFIIQSLPRLLNSGFVTNKLAERKTRSKIKKHPEIYRNVCVRNDRFYKFVDRYFTNLSEPYYGWDALVEGCRGKYDGFLCGSDQLWLPQNLGSHFYTLEFAPDDKPKIAYATSFGVSSVPWYQRKRTAKYLNRFVSLSTREIAGEKIISALTDKEARVVCDPTLLFNCEEWKEIIPEKKVVEEPYIFCYFLGNNEEHRKIAQELKKKTDLKVVTCPFLDNYVEIDNSFGEIQMFDMDSEDFINLIRNAEYILTDSFHGSVFSILNHKKFLTFNRFGEGRDSRNSRIDSLCTLLDLENRRYEGDVLAVKKDIDYKWVNSKLQSLRDSSVSYLKDALSSNV